MAYGSLGYSHHTIQDFSLMRSFPNMLILSPCDPVETQMCLDFIVSNPQPSYLRLGKTGEKIISTKVNIDIGTPNLILENGKNNLVLSSGTFLQTHFAKFQNSHDIATVSDMG